MSIDLNKVSDWAANFGNRTNVQPEVHDRSNHGGFLSAESAVIVSGPSSLKDQSALDLIPIGLVQSTQISQNKQLNELFEIGGRDSFFIPGRNQIQAQLSRILFNGPSLFYALYQRSDGDATTLPNPENFGIQTPLNMPTMPYGGQTPVVNTNTGNSNPGLFWSNLGSSVFNKPLGLGFILYNMDGVPFGGTYLEKCYIQAHSFGISANATVLAENVSLRASRVRPLNASSISDHGDSGE